MTPPDSLAVAEPTPLTAVQLPPAPRPRGVVAGVRKYTKIFRASLVERLTYRGDFLFGTLLRFLPMLTTILLWNAIYAGSGKKTLNGFSFNEMIAYLLLVNIARMFSSMPGLAAGIARDIREGTLKKYLLQPLDMIGYLVSYRVAHKVSYIISSAIPYAILFFLCRKFFIGLVPADPWIWAGFLASLMLAFLVGFFSRRASAWWLLVPGSDVAALHRHDLELLHLRPDAPARPAPPFWANLLKSLPFQYMAYFPTVVFLGKVKGMALVYGLLKEALWAGFFMLLARWLYRRGLKRYSAFGG